jgi:uncharacterized protein involved in exopolysaccharide biosynthesis
MMNEAATPEITEVSKQESSEITVLDIGLMILKRKKLVFGLPLLASTLALSITLMMPNIYTATTRIMPPQQSESSTAMLFGALSGMTGGLGGSLGSALGLKSPNDLYAGILKSQTIADRIIDRFKLKELYEEPTEVETRKALVRMTSISAGKDGLIVIEVDDEDPKRAADMANAYVEELDRLTQQLAISDAGRRRVFFERELRATRDRLGEAELAMKAVQEKSGLIQPDGQAKAIFDAYAESRVRVAAKEVEISSMRTFATENNPDLIRAREELAGLKAELAKLEKAQGGRRPGDLLVPTGNVPEAGLQYSRRLREVKYQEALFELLAKQFEMAKIDEAKDAVLIQVIDRALPPDLKSKPKRALIAMLTGLLSGLFGVLVAVALEATQRTVADPAQAQKVALLKTYLFGWRSRTTQDL